MEFVSGIGSFGGVAGPVGPGVRALSDLEGSVGVGWNKGMVVPSMDFPARPFSIAGISEGLVTVEERSWGAASVAIFLVFKN